MPFEAEVFIDGYQDILVVHVEIVICCTDKLRGILVGHQDRLRDIQIKAACYKLLCTCTYTPQSQKAQSTCRNQARLRCLL